MRRLECDNMGVQVDGRRLNHLRFADDIALRTPTIGQAEQMLVDVDDACGEIGLELNLNLMKTTFMKNTKVPDALLSSYKKKETSECSSYSGHLRRWPFRGLEKHAARPRRKQGNRRPVVNLGCLNGCSSHLV
ncbi:hypothetical protein Y032_0050g1911 [Ancylostoma ceylanicum]|uniref:Reverse transcriptase domain-containing protein n=1 Tax=Ancylostoma ceylanicum TaxID=53326 RepID=A0A016UA20_9BILA|nr:hypothetical protein Y032_0050g1911 [Ancylostoma ceylanicum]